MRQLAKILLLAVLFCGNAFGAEPLRVRTLSEIGYPAKFDPFNTLRPGFCLEVMQAIERVEPSVRFSGRQTQGTISRIVDHLVHGDIDVYFGLLKTPQRAEHIIYLEPPLYVTHQVLLVRANDPVQPASWRELGRNGTVLAVADSGQAAALHAMGGIFVDDRAVNVEANLKKLLAGRGRFLYVSENNALAGIKALGVDDKIRVLRPNFLPTSNLYVAFSRQTSSEIMRRITHALKKLEANGELRKIRARYFLRG